MEGAEGPENAAIASFAILIQAVLLATVLAVGHCLSRWKVSWIGDAGVALALGAALSALMVASNSSQSLGPFTTFNKEFFFLALLPPIIFQAGYSLNTETFFSNYGAIAACAFAGTAISTGVIGLGLWLGGLAGICTQLTLLETLLFGAIVSATDPVTVLAVFEKLHADANLYALVFGESVLNDAVAIVLYRVLAGFLHEAVTPGAIFKAVGMFMLIFVGSMAIGAAIAFGTSWVFKTHFFRSKHVPLESCLVVLLAYSSYLLADALHLSGIVSVLFCGMVMNYYTKPNMSKVSRDRTGAFFRVLAVLAETFVFVYIGSSLFIKQQAWEHGGILSFLVVSLVALAVSRAAYVLPVSAAVNYLRTEDMHIPQSHQFMLWWAGLRGAMAFALAMQAADDLPDGQGELMLSTVYVVVIVTVLVNGGSCAFFLSKLGLQADASGHDGPLPSKYQRLELIQSDDNEGASILADSGGTAAFAGPQSAASDKGADGKEGSIKPSPSGTRLDRLRQANREGILGKLNRLDERYLGRIFLADERGLEMPEVVPAGDVDIAEPGRSLRAAQATS